MTTSPNSIATYVKVGKFIAILAVVSALISVVSTLATAVMYGPEHIHGPVLPGVSGSINALTATLLLHGAMLYPVLLLAFAAGFLIVGYRKTVANSLASPGNYPGNGHLVVGSNKPLLIIGIVLVIVSFAMVAALDLAFIAPCTSRAMVCWKLLPILESPLTPRLWVPSLLALIGLIMTALAMPSKAFKS